MKIYANVLKIQVDLFKEFSKECVNIVCIGLQNLGIKNKQSY